MGCGGQCPTCYNQNHVVAVKGANALDVLIGYSGQYLQKDSPRSGKDKTTQWTGYWDVSLINRCFILHAILKNRNRKLTEIEMAARLSVRP